MSQSSWTTTWSALERRAGSAQECRECLRRAGSVAPSQLVLGLQQCGDLSIGERDRAFTRWWLGHQSLRNGAAQFVDPLACLGANGESVWAAIRKRCREIALVVDDEGGASGEW